MNLEEKISKDLKQAIKSKDILCLSVLRLLIAVIKNAEISKKKKQEGLTDQEIVELIASEIKKRKEAIEQFKKGGRFDLVEQETKELKILEKYLPEQMTEQELRKLVKQVIEQGPANFGQVMGKVMKEVKARAEGKQVVKIVQEEIKQ